MEGWGKQRLQKPQRKASKVQGDVGCLENPFNMRGWDSNRGKKRTSYLCTIPLLWINIVTDQLPIKNS